MITEIPQGLSGTALTAAVNNTIRQMNLALGNPGSSSSAAAGAPDPIAAPATATLTLTTSYQPIAGMAVQLTRAGWWQLIVTVNVSAQSLSQFQNVELTNGGASLPGLLQTVCGVSGGELLVVARPWLFQSQTGAERIVAQAKKTGGTGSDSIVGSASPASQVSQLTAVFVG